MLRNKCIFISQDPLSYLKIIWHSKFVILYKFLAKENNKIPLIFHVKKPEVTDRKQNFKRQVMGEFGPNERAIIKKSCWSKTQSALWGALVELRNED